MACSKCDWKGFTVSSPLHAGVEQVIIGQCRNCKDTARYSRAVLARYQPDFQDLERPTAQVIPIHILKPDKEYS